MKVFLADLVHNLVAGSNNVSGDQDYTVPLNVASVAAYAIHNFRGDLDVRVFKFPNQLLDAIEEETPAILGLSNYGWNTDLNKQIGRKLKEKYPELVIVMGGPAIRTTSKGIKEFLEHNRHIDLYVLYEGEGAFLDVLNLFSREGRSFLKSDSSLKNCAYLKEDGPLFYDYEKISHPLDQFPSPYLDGLLDSYLADGLIPLFETNRGCPFHCTFCTWGVSALGKVRRLSEDRVCKEMDYVAEKFPQLQAWILADANFGILPRDVEFAKHVQAIKRRTPALKRIMIWESKNTSERNLEIAKLLGLMENGRVLIALQTFEEAALEATKRKNIKFGDVEQKIKDFNEIGVDVRTDILFGLPGETYEGHLRTLRQCFEVGFDHITTVNTILLSGSEMDSQQTRRRYNLQTKFILRVGSYGEYRGTRAIECEEIVRSTSTMLETEIQSLQPLHWMLWYGWNFGFIKPLLKYLMKQHAMNPLDVLLRMQRAHFESKPRVKALLDSLNEELDQTMLDDPEALYAHYFKKENWSYLMEGGFIKPEKKFNARMLLDRDLHYDFIDYVVDTLPREIRASGDLNDIVRAMKCRFLDLVSIASGQPACETVIEISAMAARYLVNCPICTTENGRRNLRVSLSRENSELLRHFLDKFKFKEFPFHAVERIMGANHEILRPDYVLAEGSMSFVS